MCLTLDVTIIMLWVINYTITQPVFILRKVFVPSVKEKVWVPSYEPMLNCIAMCLFKTQVWGHGYCIIHEQYLLAKIVLGVGPESGRWGLNKLFEV